MAKKDSLRELLSICEQLHPAQVSLLLEMAKGMTAKIEERINPQSDILVPAFSINFSNRLRIHHATSEAKFSKKPFEYAFAAASKAAGRKALITSSQTSPGADVTVDDKPFSLKTEAAGGISAQRVKISKLMEARWIRDCLNEEDFAQAVRTRVTDHLGRYERILILRAFSVGNMVRYDLVEIPREILLEVANVTARDFSPKTPAGGSSAAIMYKGEFAFRLVLDGSVEKVIVTNLDIGLCITHGSWIVPTIRSSEA